MILYLIVFFCHGALSLPLSDGITIQQSPFTQGVLDMIHQDLYFIEAQWILGTTYSLVPLGETITTLRGSFTRIMNEGKGTEIESMNKTSMDVSQALDRADKSYSDLLASLTEQDDQEPGKLIRNKRGILDGLFHLFGFATTEDTASIQDQIKRADYEQKRFVNQIQRQTTIMRTMVGQIHSQQGHLHHLVNLTLNMESAVESLAKEKRYGTAVQVTALQHIMQSLSVIQDHILSLNQVVHSLELQELPHELMDRGELKNALLEIQQKTLGKFALAYGMDRIQHYYNNPIAHRLPSNDSISAIIAIPLIQPNQPYKLHEILPFPTLIQNNSTKSSRMKRYQWKGKKTWVALRKDYNGFKVLDQTDLDHCDKGIPKICPVSAPEYNRRNDHCLWGLLGVESEKVHNCEYEEIQDNLPRAHAISSTTWAMSLTENTTGHVTCKDQYYPVQLIPNSIIQLKEGCEILTTGITIQGVTRIQGKNVASKDPIQTFTWTQFNLPNRDSNILDSLKKTKAELESELGTAKDDNMTNILLNTELTGLENIDWTKTPSFGHGVIIAPWLVMGGLITLIGGIYMWKRWKGQRQQSTVSGDINLFGIPLTRRNRRGSAETTPQNP